MSIISRKISNSIKPLLNKGKAIVITGARQVGKTTFVKQLQDEIESEGIWFNADENITRERLHNPSLETLNNLIGDKKLIVVDEIQRIENAGLLLKLLVDNFIDRQIIATGSSAIEISNKIFEPLTGRFFLFHLYPFSFSELYPNLSNFEMEKKLEFHLIYGNYPEICIQKDIAENIIDNISQQYLYKDILNWKDIRKPELLDKLLKLLAFQIGSEVSINELSNKLQIKSETVLNYIDLLEKSFVIFSLSAYSNNLRKEVTKMRKIYFWDLGIRNSLIKKQEDLSFRDDQGALFENFIISEFLKNNSWSNKKVQSFFWRNYNQSEVDYLEINNNKIDSFEIKWNKNKKHKVSSAFTSLYPEAKTNIITKENFGSIVDKS